MKGNERCNDMEREADEDKGRDKRERMVMNREEEHAKD